MPERGSGSKSPSFFSMTIERRAGKRWVRVRKLAKELERTPDDLLLVLKDLGYDRFKSADDMISDEVAAVGDGKIAVKNVFRKDRPRLPPKA